MSQDPHVSLAPALRAEAVVRRFADAATRRQVEALSGVSFTVPSGALTALVGPDGAGKTTLMRLAAGLLVPDGGRLEVLGLDVAREPQAVQDRLGYMPQRFGLYEDLSVQENLDLYADLHGVAPDERRARYARLLEMTDLARFTTRLAGQLSGGMKQKLGLACTLVRRPDLLLLDEPTVGVDPLSRRELWGILEQLVRDEGLSVLVSTSYLDEAERCAQVLLLREGRLLAQGTPESLRRVAEGRTFMLTPPQGELPRALQARLLARPDAVLDAVPHAGRVHVIVADAPEAAARAAGVQASALEPVQARVEDGFMVLLRNAQARVAAEAQAAPPPSPAGPAASTANDDGPVIEVKDLVRRFGDFTAVAQTSFSVRRGEVFGLLGPNGAGKTTTFRMLCGLLPPSGGTLRVAGLDMRSAPGHARRQLGYVSQKFALYGNLSAAENLAFFAGAYGLPPAEAQRRVDDVAREFGLEDHLATPSAQLPGGYRQRLAMAAALLHRPGILFLDEPTSGADPLARRDFWQRITALAQGGTTVVVTTHFMEEAEYCDRLVIQDAGRVLALGTPGEIRQRAGDAADMEQAFIAIVEQARRGSREAPKSEAAAIGQPFDPVDSQAARQPSAEARHRFWSRLRSLTRKETRQLLRDRANLAFGLVLPIALILLFGYGITLDVTDAPVAVVLEDASPQAREAVSGLQRTPWIHPVFVPTMAEAETLIVDRRVDGIVRVPSDFASALAAGRAHVQLVVHGSDAATARVVQSYVQGALAQATLEDADAAGAGPARDPRVDLAANAPRPGHVQVESRLWFNVANTSTWYLVPGLLVLIMTLVGAFLTSLLVAREWERGTMEALLVTPARPLEILLSKMIPYFGVGMLGCSLCLVAARWLFHLPFEGSVALIVLASMLYLVVALGMGLLISSVTKNQFLASQVALIASFLPAMMLSGFLFDLRNVPVVVRAVAQVLPATHFLELVKTLLLAGDVGSVVKRDLALLALYAVGFVVAARLATRKRLA